MRYLIRISLALFIIIMPSLYLFYRYWIYNNPPTGPVGNGILPISGSKLVFCIVLIVLGLSHLIFAIYQYRRSED